MATAVVVLALGLGAALWVWHGRGRGVSAPHNLVLVSVDTLRADHLSCYGSSPVPTPNIDRIAREGVLFEQVQTVAPTTLPAHASLFTGLSPLRHGVRDNVGFYLSKDPPTLASLLREAGYRTGGFVGAFVLDSRFGISRGFETYFDRFDALTEDVAPGFVSQRRAGVVLDEALKWMESAAAGAFFTFIHFYDPHTPYDPPPAFAPTERTSSALYRGEVAYVDFEVGRLLKWLDDHGLGERTVVVLTSDHGESLGEHGEKTHGLFLYESTLHVPLIIRAPGAAAGKRIEELVRIVDVAPTLLELLGLPVPDSMEGAPLGASMAGSARGGELPAYAETYLPRLQYGWSQLRSLRRGPYKLILAPRSELYRIDTDPEESHNLMDAQPAVAERLRKELENFISPARSAPPRARRLDRETLEKLRALGYARSPSPMGPERPFTELADPKDRIGVYETINDPTLLEVRPEDKERFRRALAAIRSVLKEDPSMPRAQILYGELLLKQGRAPEAARAFERALALHPGSFAAAYGLAMAQLALGRFDRAEAHLRQAVDNEPENTKGYYRLAELERSRGRLPAAEKWLRRGITIHPDRLLQEKLAEVLIELGRSAEAETILLKLADRYGQDAVTLYNLGQALLARDNGTEALPYLRRAVRLSPEDADIHQALGNALAAAGDRQAAAGEFRRAIELSPCFAGAHSNLGTTLLQLGRVDEAVRSYERAIACDPQYALAYTNLASVLLQKGQVERAIEMLRRAVALRPDDVELQRALRDLEARKGSRR